MTQKTKYSAPKKFEMAQRQWPGNEITFSPQWCSVDLRDGNQSLPNPLSPAAKLEYFQLLCEIGFKHIEIAFPSASQDDFDFTRKLIEEDFIPSDVFIMGLVQCRPHLIDRTFEAFAGVKRAVVHAYAACSPLHREKVFHLDRQKTLDMAVKAITQIRQLADTMPDSDIRVEFSPEEFTDTEMDFSLEICTAVYEAWGKACPEKPMILNLPATVERRPPNHYADMIEIFCDKFPYRKNVIISLHAHNDQGMAVAATELALLAGADRVEGTLFGHGERTGNVDIVTLANNLASRGIDTGLNFKKLPHIAETVSRLTGMEIYYRQPYAGELVFTAFSGSHQDAIRKGLADHARHPEKWYVPYLHIDPADVGREYEGLIRINSQSGKGGVTYVLEQDYGLEIPKEMQPELGRAAQKFSDTVARELSGDEVKKIFDDEFLNFPGKFALVGYWPRPADDNPTNINGHVKIKAGDAVMEMDECGNGPIDAFVHCIRKFDGVPGFIIESYHEQAIGEGADAQAMAYVGLKFDDGKIMFGVGTDTNIDQAAAKAILTGINRKLK